jgi:DNA-directed RNA polymerase specialized sigma24 family protein
MTVERLRQDSLRIAPEEALAGILALMVDAREASLTESSNPAKTEVLLANAGLSVNDIVKLTGKKEGAVRKTIERARKK